MTPIGLRSVPFLASFVFVAIALGLPPFASAQDGEFAALEAYRGQLTIVRLGSPLEPSLGMALERNDTVVTRRGTAAIRFTSDGTQVRVGPDSRVQINDSAGDRDIEVFFGRLWARVVSFRDRQTRVRTGATIAAVRGTEIAVDYDEQQTLLWVFEGEMMAENPSGSLTISGGQSAVASTSAPPALRVTARPQDAVQWSLYYMPVLFDDELTGQEDRQRAIRESIEAYRRGDLGQALDAVGDISDASITDTRFLTHRASLYLAAGSVDDASADIERALALERNDAGALALQTIVAIALNDNDRALSTARRAVSADAQSASAQIALSYAQQALFDLEGARATLEAAADRHPDNALVWARLSELHLSFGDLGEALDAARMSAEHEPNLVRSQTVLGYAYLTQVRTREAREAFQKAIALDQGDPVPRLGLGLVMIRDGHLSEGRREIEVASSLDPGSSVIRSYLGKSYFEEKRAELDQREYEMAKQVDPNDPTPWFYDAIAKQTTNRPVEALEDLQEAIDLNDNRAVYRSRLLLDSDLAARSASQARIYTDLGFQDRALVDGWTSVNTDPTNYSAHRFLADSYSVLPRHEVARVSELFQSQMLQPLNTTPIQPRLGESNLFLISSGGPGSLSFNEFNPLFNRNGVNVQATGLFGNDGLWSGEGVLAGIYDKVSLSVGYNQFETDGWRENAFQNDKIANVFVQVELTPEASIQAEYRHRDLMQGDLQQRFYQDAYLPGLVNEELRDTFRVGGRYAMSPSSILLVSFTYQDTDFNTNVELAPDFSFESTVPQKSHGTEIQHLYRSRYVNLTSGVGYFKIDGELQARLNFDGFIEELPTISTEFDHVNVYSYANIKPVTSVTLTAGGSLDHLSGDLPGSGDDQFNPKIGVMWNPVATTTLRAAAFQTLKRTLVTDQTLEPTQVAGFNQFYDDSDLTRGWRYGGGIDQRIGNNIFAGGEYSTRDLTVPFLDLESTLHEAPWDESMTRAYLFAAPHPWFGLRTQYIFERFERDEGCELGGARECLTLGFKTVDTHRVPLGVALFHPSGLSAFVTATYWQQEGEFEQLELPVFEGGRSTFWLVDLGVNFRLPKRYGFISVGAANVFDEQFDYFEVDFDNPTIQPTRTFYAKFTLAVP
jgi:tetratricopeptide (TPR) repeat protein